MNYSEYSSKQIREIRDIESRLESISRWFRDRCFREAPTDELEAVAAAIKWNAPMADADKALLTARRLIESHSGEE